MNGSSILSGMAARVVLAVWLVALSGATLANVECDGGPTCTQTIELTAGWNAIYLQVTPDDMDPTTDSDAKPATIFASMSVSSVWTWLAHRATVDYVTNPNPEKLLSEPGWLRYFPASTAQSFATNLFAMSANRAYLVKMEQAGKLVVTGRPVVPKMKWQSQSFNFTGFHIDPTDSPTFSEFFAASPAHRANLSVYKLNGENWSKVLNTTEIEPDKAYWVYSEQGSDYTGALGIDIPLLNRLDFGEALDRQTIAMKNAATTAQKFTVKALGAAVGLYYEDSAITEGNPWMPLSNLNQTIDKLASKGLRVGVRRTDFVTPHLEMVLEVTGGESHSRWLIPTTADAELVGNGLWVGSVTVDHVTQVQNYQHDCGDSGHELCVENVGRLQDTCDTQGENPGNGGNNQCKDNIPVADNCNADGLKPGTGDQPCDEFQVPVEGDNTVLTPVAQEFSFRVIMHNDDAGQVSLLKEVILMREVDPDTAAVRHVLVTNDEKISELTGVALRDGEIVGKRISTVAYDFEGNSQVMNGAIGSTLNITLDLGAKAPTNPFRHLYHAQHGSGYDITRTMEFTFGVTGATSFLREGYDVYEGTYREEITGLHKRPIVATGTFRLQHAAPIDRLN